MQKRLEFLLFTFILCIALTGQVKEAHAEFGYVDDPFSDFSFSSSFFGRGRSQQIISLEVNPQRTLDTSFRIAAREGRMKEVKFFLQKGAEINSRSTSGETALIYAVKNCSKKLIEFLIQYGADVNAKDLEGRTPLIHAASGSCLPAAEAILKSSSVDLNAKDRRLKTAKDYAEENAVFEVDGPSDEILHLMENFKKRKSQKGPRQAAGRERSTTSS